MNSENESDGSLVPFSSSDWKPQVIDVPDLVNLIADYCDDESVSKLSRVFATTFISFNRLARMSER